MEEMTKEELTKTLIEQFMNLQRIQKAEDAKKEINYQMVELRAELEALGVVVENLIVKD